MADPSPVRIAAPLALVAAAVGIVVVVAASQPGGDTTPVRASRPPAHRIVHHKPRPHIVVVRSGDTLSAISSRTGVALETLQALNPNVDPQALQTGQRLKLTR
jgi:Tfp pilus assembly protein FimV